MKAKIILSLCIFICIVILFTNQIIIADLKPPFYSVAKLTAIKHHIEDDADITSYSAVQGACTDENYAYFALDNGKTTLLKYRLPDFELVKRTTYSTIGHANDMTYNPKTHQLIVANNCPDYKTVTFIDPNTLKITGSQKLSHNIYCIAYNENTDKYIVGISGGYDFAILDKNFKTTAIHKGHNSGYIRQGCDADKNYIYFAQSGGGQNVIVVYNYSGQLIDIISIKMPHEIENIFHTKSTMYLSLFQYTNTVYTAKLSDIRYN